MLVRVTTIIALVMCGLVAPGQQADEAKKGQPKLSPSPERSFGVVLSERDSLSKEISDLDTDIYWIRDAISKIADEDNIGKRTKELDQGIASSMNTAHLPPKAKRDDLDTYLDNKTQLIQKKKEQKDQLDAELAKRAEVIAPQQHFKLQMSGIFAALVAVVICGFFFIATRDEKVRQEIFAGQAGIQFVTLFSLVIAIILFGIIDILEGKELAALLGGLSGYILGRSTSGAPAHAAVTVSPPVKTVGSPAPQPS